MCLFGAMREVPPVDKPLFDRYTDKELEDIAEFPVNANAGGLPPEMQARMRTYMERHAHDRQGRAVLCR